MCNVRRLFLTGLMLGLILGSMMTRWTEQVQSKDKYPVKPINIIVPFGAGGGTDLSFRYMTPYMKKKWNVPVNVVNKPGGNTVPACLEVHGARPDGYTLLGDNLGSGALVRLAVKNLPFKVMERTFMGIYAATPVVFTVPSTSSIKSFKDLIAEAKKSPENITWTSMGGTGTQDLCARQFFQAIGVDLSKTKPVTSKSGAEATALISGGHVLMGLSGTSSSLSGITAGLTRPLAISGAVRWSGLQDVPTTAELGYPTITAANWVGPSGPPKTPTYIVEIWEKALKEMLNDPEVISIMKKLGQIPFYHNAQESREYIMKLNNEISAIWGLK